MTESDPPQNHKSSWLVCILIAVSTFINGSCTNYPEEMVSPEINREAFINTYIILSAADMTNLEARDSIFHSLNISSDDLEAFVNFHGSDVDFMAEIWDEIEAGIDQALNEYTLVPQ